MNWHVYKKIHFIGIGGIGVSAVARIMLEFGKQVSGSDVVDSEIIKNLQQLGARINTGKHKVSNLSDDTDLVVFTNASEDTNPEFVKAKRLKIPTLSYPNFLGKLISNYIPIVVTGTHGKSSTTAMLSKIFIEAGLDPTVVIGANIQELKGNARVGLGRYFILEGDEYQEAFLNYQPAGLIINNIEADHLDYYKNMENIIKSFKVLTKRIPRGGFIVANVMDDNVIKAITGSKCRIIKFGLEYGDYYATHIVRHGELTRFAVKGLESFDLAIRVPGDYNVQNALAAAVMSLAFGIPHDVIQKALLNYQGAWRRFEIKGKKKGITVVDDYAHHPTEIKAVLKSAREYFPNKRLWCVFQPHSKDRTKKLFKDFVNSFSDCDKLVLTEIYKVEGREKKLKISSRDLEKAIKKVKSDVILVKSLNKVSTYLKRKVKTGDVVITMGAGDITKISDELITKI